jgi:outer membrane PBP1 activator LpoA protein
VARRLVAVLVAALALAGCGGSSKDSEPTTTTTQSTAATQATYANSLCGSLSTWKNSLTSVATTLRGGNLTKEKLKQSATTVSDANKRLADDLDTLGTPPKIGEPKAKAAVDTLSNELDAAARQIEQAAKGISTAQDALAAVSTVSSTLIKLSTDISTTITELQGLNVAQGWKQAFANSATCQSLSKS